MTNIKIWYWINISMLQIGTCQCISDLHASVIHNDLNFYPFVASISNAYKMWLMPLLKKNMIFLVEENNNMNLNHDTYWTTLNHYNGKWAYYFLVFMNDVWILGKQQLLGYMLIETTDITAGLWHINAIDVHVYWKNPCWVCWRNQFLDKLLDDVLGKSNRSHAWNHNWRSLCLQGRVGMKWRRDRIFLCRGMLNLGPQMFLTFRN